MSHPDARLELVQHIEAGWPQTGIARQFRVSRATVAKSHRRCQAMPALPAAAGSPTSTRRS